LPRPYHISSRVHALRQESKWAPDTEYHGGRVTMKVSMDSNATHEAAASRGSKSPSRASRASELQLIIAIELRPWRPRVNALSINPRRCRTALVSRQRKTACHVEQGKACARTGARRHHFSFAPARTDRPNWTCSSRYLTSWHRTLGAAWTAHRSDIARPAPPKKQRRSESPASSASRVDALA